MENFLNKIYTLIVQHMAYVRRLEAACNENRDFPHKTERECDFGKLLYTEVMPFLDEMPEDVRRSVLEIEMLHTDFHVKARELPGHGEKLNINDLHRITDFLIIRLTKLERGKA